MFGWHHAVSADPGHEGGTVEARQAFGATSKLVSAAAARSIRTASRRISGWDGTGFIHRAVAASPRWVSLPNAIGSCRTARIRICCMNNPNIRGGSLPGRRSVSPVSLGGKLSNASQEASTTRPTRLAPSHITN
jgi:hypothetical protein